MNPQSDNALGDWVRSTALPELFGPGIAQGGRDRFYRVADLLWKNRDKIEAHLRTRHRQMFSLQRTLVLYDLTNTYFEGRCAANPKARRGHSKHKRNDCPQIVVGMVFDEHGFPLPLREGLRPSRIPNNIIDFRPDLSVQGSIALICSA